MTILRSESRSALAGESVLVIGGRGFVGSHVVRALVAAGARPHLFGPAMAEDRLVDLAGAYDESEGSIASRDALREALRVSGAASLVSCAAHGVGRLGLMRSGEAEADAAFSINVMGLNNVLEAAREAKLRRVVWASSTVVYGPADLYGGGLVDEDAVCAPTTFYGLTKVMAEAAAAYHSRRHGLPVTGLRLPLVLGPGLWYEGAAAALARLFEAARAGSAYSFAFHDELIDLMHASDAAAAVLPLLAHRGGLAQVYNLEGFKARASDLVRETLRQRPCLDIRQEIIAPPMLFPLITGARLRADLDYSARYDLPAFVAAMLGEETH